MTIDTITGYGATTFGGYWPTLWAIVRIVLVVVPLLLCVAYLTLWERKAIGWSQIRPGPNGITAQAASAGMMVMTGPRKNRPLLAAVGTMISLKISFTASAIGCNRPSGPTRFGPGRIWLQPIALRSQSVR